MTIADNQATSGEILAQPTEVGPNLHAPITEHPLGYTEINLVPTGPALTDETPSSGLFKSIADRFRQRRAERALVRADQERYEAHNRQYNREIVEPRKTVHDVVLDAQRLTYNFFKLRKDAYSDWVATRLSRNTTRGIVAVVGAAAVGFVAYQAIKMGHTMSGNSHTTTGELPINPKLPHGLSDTFAPKGSNHGSTITEMMPRNSSNVPVATPNRVNTDAIDHIRPKTVAKTDFSWVPETPKGFSIDNLPSVNAKNLKVKDPEAALNKAAKLYSKISGQKVEVRPSENFMLYVKDRPMNQQQLQEYNFWYLTLIEDGEIAIA